MSTAPQRNDSSESSVTNQLQLARYSDLDTPALNAGHSSNDPGDSGSQLRPPRYPSRGSPIPQRTSTARLFVPVQPRFRSVLLSAPRETPPASLASSSAASRAPRQPNVQDWSAPPLALLPTTAEGWPIYGVLRIRNPHSHCGIFARAPWFHPIAVRDTALIDSYAVDVVLPGGLPVSVVWSWDWLTRIAVPSTDLW